MKNCVLSIVLLVLLLPLVSFYYQDDIIGVWANSSNKAQVQIYKYDGRYFGKIIWLKNAKDANGKPKVDHRNPDESARNQPVIGLVILRDFKYEDDQWKQGKIYNPNDGNEYKAYIKMQDKKHLLVRGYIGFSLLGKTEIFTRVR